MAILEIKEYPDPILKQKAKPVEHIDDSIRRLLDDMVETMYAAPGVGLAAPQVGVSLRVIVVDASPKDEGAKLMKLINPVITHSEGSISDEEGCLSIPEISGEVVRAKKISVEALDENGKPVSFTTDTFLARVIQHEIDHLNGILFIDRLSRLKQDLIKRKLKKRAKKEEPKKL
jgi:peptide deformylase